MNEEIEFQKKECNEVFMKTSTFWKLVVSGIVVIIGIGSGAVTYAMSTSNVTAKQEVQINNLDSRLIKIEGKLDNFDNKLDVILRSIKSGR